MRRIAGSARYFRSALWHRKFDYWSSFTTRPKDLTENYHNCAYGVTNNAEIESFLRSKFMVSRALSTDAAASASIGEVHRAAAGPLVEYERRIIAGELLDGDVCQLGTLGELQRLYDELVESADACKLDRYSSSEKSGDSPVSLQESVAVVTFTATIFILTCQRIVPLWGSRDWENNVDGPIFLSIALQLEKEEDPFS
ncbi:hypothetical protein CISIN_1g046724mg [Citrus sinensis]|uniref:Uncharacterized protein n=1 Tax=Citrus sinensis TaxID=2711 RepID=A0A067FFU2_CITSI|nr:hypothetical protein CISIN_1g046724mg [Citrus sinensis]